MNENLETLLFATILVLLLYPILMRVLSEQVHPARIRMAELGKALLGSQALTSEQKEMVRCMLRDAFDWRFMLTAFFIAPFSIMNRKGCDQNNGCGNRCDCCVFGSKDEKTLRMVSEFSHCHLKATVAANPLFALFLMIEMIIMFLILWPFGKIKGVEDLKSYVFSSADRLLRQHHIFGH